MPRNNGTPTNEERRQLELAARQAAQDDERAEIEAEVALLQAKSGDMPVVTASAPDMRAFVGESDEADGDDERAPSAGLIPAPARRPARPSASAHGGDDYRDIAAPPPVTFGNAKGAARKALREGGNPEMTYISLGTINRNGRIVPPGNPIVFQEDEADHVVDLINAGLLARPEDPLDSGRIRANATPDFVKRQMLRGGDGDAERAAAARFMNTLAPFRNAATG